MTALGSFERRAFRFWRASAAAGFLVFSAIGTLQATLLPPSSSADMPASSPLVL